MSWAEDLASGLGLPAGAVTIATAMYAACVAAEKSARPEAIQDISHFLRSATGRTSLQSSAIINGIFNATFGVRHLSAICLERSTIATLAIMTATILGVSVSTKTLPYPIAHASFLLALLILGIVPDYLALWKTRILLHSRMIPIMTVILDICASLAISAVVFSIFDTFYFRYMYGGSFSKAFTTATLLALPNNLKSIGDFSSLYLYPIIFFRSTLLTSIWTTLIFISSAVLKILTPVQWFTVWFFDVENHPITAIGLVASLLTVVGSLVWLAARAAL